MSPVPAGSCAGMTDEKKIAHKIDELAGKGKETLGRATGNPDLEAQGRNEQARSNLQQAGDKIKDALR